MSGEQDGPGARGRGDGQRVGFVLAKGRDIPPDRQFSAEDLRQVAVGLLYAAGCQNDDHTKLKWRGLAHRIRGAAVALREGRQPEPDSRCFGCGRRV